MSDAHQVGPIRPRLGFIGLGVMGEPICRNLARKSGLQILGFDRASEPLDRLAAFGVQRAENLATLAARGDVIFMALPSGRHVQEVCEAPDGLIAHACESAVVVDLGTSPVDLTRDLAQKFAARGVAYADAPIARTRQAAEDGTLSVMVGADEATFARIEPLLRLFATNVTHCGAIGCGQIVKILNNMVLVETVVALTEALAVARRAGLDGKVLFETLAKGSADSFALRNHGLKALLPGVFPERAFSTDYARKDISYALALAASVGVATPGAQLADGLLQAASDRGDGDRYWPVIGRPIDESTK